MRYGGNTIPCPDVSECGFHNTCAGQREEWEDQLDELAATIRRTALQLSARRRAAAAALRTAVEGCLKELAMGGSRFDVRIGEHA